MEYSGNLVKDLSSLPKEKWWGDDYLFQLGGFWFPPELIQPITSVTNHFKPFHSDVILASFPNTGTTWLKALLHSIINRSSKHELAIEHPHILVPFLEYQGYGTPLEPTLVTPSIDTNHSRRILSTHIPYQLLAKTLDSFECRIVYVTRNPKDTLVAKWHFVNKLPKEELWTLEVAAEKFSSGLVPYGPYYDHVIGYKDLSLEMPKNVYFQTYEDLKNDPNTHVKNLAMFLGCPFKGEDVEGQVQEIVNNCSFEVLSNHDVNKSEEFMPWFPLRRNSFFRKGIIGDHKNYLNQEIVEKIDAITRDKFHASGFMYGV